MRLLSLGCLVPLLGAAPAACAGDSPHAVLEAVARQSSHVVAGTILDEPVRQFDDDQGVANYRVRVGSVETLVGPSDLLGDAGSEGGEDRGENVTVRRYESDPADRPAFLRAGARVVLFLTWDEDVEGFATADPWFGVQPHSRSLAETTKRVGTRVWQRRGLSELGVRKLNETRPVERALEFAEDRGIDLAKYDVVRATAFRPMGMSHLFHPNPEATGGPIEWRVVVPPARGEDLPPLEVAVPDSGRPWRL